MVALWIALAIITLGIDWLIGLFSSTVNTVLFITPGANAALRTVGSLGALQQIESESERVDVATRFHKIVDNVTRSTAGVRLVFRLLALVVVAGFAIVAASMVAFDQRAVTNWVVWIIWALYAVRTLVSARRDIDCIRRPALFREQTYFIME